MKDSNVEDSIGKDPMRKVSEPSRMKITTEQLFSALAFETLLPTPPASSVPPNKSKSKTKQNFNIDDQLNKGKKIFNSMGKFFEKKKNHKTEASNNNDKKKFGFNMKLAKNKGEIKKNQLMPNELDKGISPDSLQKPNLISSSSQLTEFNGGSKKSDTIDSVNESEDDDAMKDENETMHDMEKTQDPPERQQESRTSSIPLNMEATTRKPKEENDTSMNRTSDNMRGIGLKIGGLVQELTKEENKRQLRESITKVNMQLSSAWDATHKSVSNALQNIPVTADNLNETSNYSHKNTYEVDENGASPSSVLPQTSNTGQRPPLKNWNSLKSISVSNAFQDVTSKLSEKASNAKIKLEKSSIHIAEEARQMNVETIVAQKAKWAGNSIAKGFTFAGRAGRVMSERAKNSVSEASAAMAANRRGSHDINYNYNNSDSVRSFTLQAYDTVSKNIFSPHNHKKDQRNLSETLQPPTAVNGPDIAGGGRREY